MRFQTYEELAPELDLARSAVHDGAFGGTYPRDAIAAWRSRSDALADYVGLFAVESSEILAQCYVQRIPYAFPEGESVIGGLAAVGTRPDRGGRGIARRLLTEVGRRERDAGIDHVALWTNRSWGAHRLYERLGFRDIYEPPTAIRAPARSSPRAIRPPIHVARTSDLPEVQALHDRLARRRWGFARRPAGAMLAAAAAGDLDAPKELLVLRHRGVIEGYAQVRAGKTLVSCGELMATSPGVARRLVRAVEGLGARRPIAFGYSVLRDLPRAFPPNRFTRLDSSWYVLMGCRWGRAAPTRAVRRAFGTEDRRFLCLSGDRF